MKTKLQSLRVKAEKKFEEQFGFKLYELSFSNIVEYLHQPKDASSLAVTRILFGLAMVFDIPDERGGATLDRRWGDPMLCHFPLLPFLQAIPMPYMVLVYAPLWIGAVGIMIGYKYHISTVTFAICYWYLFLIEKSYWNNHSYLFGLVGVLMAFTDANCYWSLDAYMDPSKRKETVPYWNYFILKYQFFILYFMAGVKKGSSEWLSGYSVQSLGEHWVFAPFRLVMTVEQIDYLVVHWFIFVFDLTVAVWMMWSWTRHVAMIFCAAFHLMNSRLFRIGMFPWVCLATMPLFYPFDWPKLIKIFIHNKYLVIRNKFIVQNSTNKDSEEDYKKSDVTKNKETNEQSKEEEANGFFEARNKEDQALEDQESQEDEVNEVNEGKENNKVLVEAFLGVKIKEREMALNNEENRSCTKTCTFKKITVFLIMFHVMTQAFLPFSHFITKGYNNWTDGLYGYSWDMMVHTWDAHSVVVKVVDNEKNKQYFIDPWIFAPNDRWSRHGDMVYQYARCFKNMIEKSDKMPSQRQISNNISIYIDVWFSMNGRFAQRMFDPKVDILTIKWSPFEPIPYLMPILDEGVGWRSILDQIRKDVHTWSQYSDVTFFADYPGYGQEKFISKELQNVTLTVLGGVVSFEPEVTNYYLGQSMKLTAGDNLAITPGTFHKVLNIGEAPVFYMYTFYNTTEASIGGSNEGTKPKLPIGNELLRRFNNMVKFWGFVTKGVLQIIRASYCPLCF